MPETLSSYFEFAKQVAWEAGQQTLGYFQAGVRPDWKEDDTPVTIADRQAEQYIRTQIEKRFPTHEIVGEEFGESAAKEGVGKATHRWIIDPIDGTKSFIRGVPIYSVLVALEIEGNVEVGIANFPALNEMVAAASGLGCWWNGRRSRVSDIDQLDRSVVAHIDTASFERHGKDAAWQRLQRSSYYNAGWCDAYGYALVATGRVEVMLDPIVSVWDCAPMAPIMREAGGYFGDWKGNHTIYAGESLATNAALKTAVLDVLAG